MLRSEKPLYYRLTTPWWLVFLMLVVVLLVRPQGLFGRPQM